MSKSNSNGICPFEPPNHAAVPVPEGTNFLQPWGFWQEKDPKPDNDKWYTLFAGRFNDTFEKDVMVRLQASTQSSFYIDDSGRGDKAKDAEKCFVNIVNKGSMIFPVSFGGKMFKLLGRAVVYRCCKSARRTQATKKTMRGTCSAQVRFYRALVRVGDGKPDEVRIFVVIDGLHDHETEPRNQRPGEKVTDVILTLHDQGLRGLDLRDAVKSQMRNYLEEKKLPLDERNRMFFPAEKDFENISKSFSTGKNIRGSGDVEMLEKSCKRWKEEGHLVFFEAQPQNDEGKAENFTLVFQPKESAALIEEFGETINIDATCQTNMHGLPMFLVCTNTTQGYRILQVIVTFDQTKATITKALQIIKDWNPTWEPTISMTDMDLGEINGLKAVFPSLKHQMLCDFHVQQAWNREVKGFFKGEPEKQKEALSLLRSLQFAKAPVRVTDSKPLDYFFQQKLEQAFLLDIVKDNPAFKNYLVGYTSGQKRTGWPECYRQHVPYHRNCRTNNGVEALNRVIKHDVLKTLMKGKVSMVLQKIIDVYLPDVRLRAYQEAGRSDPSCKRRLFLKGYPDWFNAVPDMHIASLMHSFNAHKEVTVRPHPDEFGLWIAIAKSQDLKGYDRMYKVNPSDPSCDCLEFIKWMMPCKHLFAVFCKGQIAWESLPEEYRKKPEFNPWREVIYTYTELVPRPDKRSEPSPRITEEVELAPASASSSTSQSISVTDEATVLSQRNRAVYLTHQMTHEAWACADHELPALIKDYEALLKRTRARRGTKVDQFNPPAKKRKKKRASFDQRRLAALHDEEIDDDFVSPPKKM